MEFLTEYGKRNLYFESGTLAKQADGSVLIRYGDTVVLVTVCLGKTEVKGQSFIPLLVDYRERTYAAGKIPGGFFKREGRPREKEILISRLTDRSIRPLIPATVNKEIQVIVTVLSSDCENETDVPALIGTSIATLISGVDFYGPVGAVRIGYTGTEFIINPQINVQDSLILDFIVAGTKNGLMMLEGSAKEVSTDIFISGLNLAQQEIAKIIAAQYEFIHKLGVSSHEINPLSTLSESKDEFTSFLDNLARISLRETLTILSKKERELRFKQIIDTATTQVKSKFSEEYHTRINAVLDKILEEETRNLIVTQKLRPDGRSATQLRKISCLTGILPRTHGSALFTRGETQSLATVTLGTPRDMQIVDDLTSEYRDRFMLHYNFPPFSTGEVKPDRGPGRREIGHGALAKRALRMVIPDENTFPYAIRIVSDILESNGSSSMATVCGGSLALMDAGVNIKNAVSGVAMGLIQNPATNEHVILTDIQGAEDHYGDMDFKVAGSKEGITAIQMDAKITGIEINVLSATLSQADRARKEILNIMNETISIPKTEISAYAPRIVQIKIVPDKIRDVIGTGGKTINKIQNETGAEIEIEDSGLVTISGPNLESVNSAQQMIEYYTADVEIGRVYKGKVTRIVNFGAFVEILPGKEGLVHISQLEERRVNRVEDVVQEGDEITVKVVEIDSQGRINLSRKACLS